MKKIVIAILSIVLLFMATTSAQYLYFSWNWNENNWFQEGCWEKYYVYYSWWSSFDNFNVKWVMLEATIQHDSQKIEYKPTIDSSLELPNIWEYQNKKFKDSTNYVYVQLLNKYNWTVNSWYYPSEKWIWLIFRPKINSSWTTTFSFLNTNWCEDSWIWYKDSAWEHKYCSQAEQSKSITIVKAPCVNDITAPLIVAKQWNKNLSWEKKILKDDWIVFYLTENGWVSTTTDVPYIFDSSNTWTNNNGTISNQYWVDADTINLTISCNTCHTPWTKTITWWTIAWNSYSKTWQNKVLNYSWIILSSQLSDFEVEKQIKILWTVSDNARSSSLLGTTKQGTINITFNNPEPPYLTGDIYPWNNKSYIPYFANIEFDIKDDWAGVSGESITVVLSGINWTDYFDDNVSLDLTCLNENESDCGTLWKNWWYHVVASHTRFPWSGNIQVIVNASDLWWESMDAESREFQVAPNCSEMAGCCDPVEIWYGENKVIDGYTWSELTVSGANVTVFNFEEYVLSWVTYTWWIFEIDCHQVDSALALYTWTESEYTEIMSGLLLDELILSWSNPETIRAELDWNQLTLSYWVDGAEITQNSPVSWTLVQSNQVDVSWSLSQMDSYDWLSGFVVTIYTWDNSENLVSTWFAAWNWTTYIFNNIPEWTSYYWSIYPVDKAGRTWNIVSTWAFAVSVTNWRDSATVVIDEPNEDNHIYNTWNIDLQWHLSGDAQTPWLIGSMSGYKLELYNSGACEWSTYASWIYGSGTTWYSVTGLVDWDYCVRVSVVDNNNEVWNWTSRSFSISLTHQVTMVANLWSRWNQTNPNRYWFASSWLLMLYKCSTRDSEQHREPDITGLVAINNSWYWISDIFATDWCYDVVYKWWNNLAVYLTWFDLTTENTVINFVTWWNIIGTIKYVYNNEEIQYNTWNLFIVAWDMPNKDWLYNWVVNLWDYTLIADTPCNYTPAWTALNVPICDLNHDNKVDVNDADVVLSALSSHYKDITPSDGIIINMTWFLSFKFGVAWDFYEKIEQSLATD